MENKLEKLKAEGYDPVYVWEAAPDEEDKQHTHIFDTHLVVLKGEIEVAISGQNIRRLQLDDEMDIPMEQIHRAKAGKNGCTYIVAEKHSVIPLKKGT